MALRRNNGKREHGAAGADSILQPQLLHALLEGLEEGIANVSPGGEILYANSRFVELLCADSGFREFAGNGIAKRLFGRKLNRLISAASWNDLDAALSRGALEPTEGEITVEVRPGCLRTIRLCLRPLSARILQLQDQERRRIARDLHDITGQELAVVVMSLNQIAKSLDKPGVNVERAIVDAVGLVRKIEDEVRSLSYVLHPPLLDEFGLASALQWYADGFRKRSGIEVEVECPRGLPRFATEKETALFRVVQESLTNVLRHSGSAKAWIRLSIDPAGIRLSVEDEGRGIGGTSAAVTGRKSATGVGILGMRERLQQLGGSLEICPRARGTQVIASLPIDQTQPAAAAVEASVRGSVSD